MTDLQNNIEIQLSLDSKCTLFASNNYSLIPQISKYGIIEILSDFDNNLVIQKLHSIESELDPWLNKTEGIKLLKDGVYNYYQILVPKLEYYLSDGIYNVENKYFIYNNNVYKGKSNFPEFSESKVDFISDYTIIWDDKDLNNQMFWFTDMFLSMCKLKNCLVKKIEIETKKFIKDGCVFECSKNDELKLQIDFLLESIFAINYLAEKGNLEDAQRIINSITQCNKICEDSAYHENNCGCE